MSDITLQNTDAALTIVGPSILKVVQRKNLRAPTTDACPKRTWSSIFTSIPWARLGPRRSTAMSNFSSSLRNTLATSSFAIYNQQRMRSKTVEVRLPVWAPNGPSCASTPQRWKLHIPPRYKRHRGQKGVCTLDDTFRRRLKWAGRTVPRYHPFTRAHVCHKLPIR